MTSSRAASDATTAREYAYLILSAAEKSGEFTELLLEKAAPRLEPRAVSQARYLIATVIRRRLTLETVLKQFVTREVEPGLWMLLKLGAAQILFGAREHRHADVNETVEVARTIGQPRWCKFLNGVLRNIDRAVTDKVPDSLGPATYPGPSAAELRSLNKPVFPDPSADFSGYVSTAFSLPRWLVDRWKQRYSREELLTISGWYLASHRLSLRVNLSKISRDELLDRFSERQIDAVAGQIECSIEGPAEISPTDLPGWNTGLLVVQDETAQQASITLAPQPRERVLDLCAAPGTKTVHLADLMQNEGTLIATDISSDRLEKIRENADRCGFDIIQMQQIAADGTDIPTGPFDAILLDAPCTNTGVLGKRLEARWRIKPNDVTELSALQARLLSQAAKRLKSGGRILYSTCSLEPEENELVVRQFLSSRSDFSLTAERTFLPGQPGDGGYQALLVQNSGG